MAGNKSKVSKKGTNRAGKSPHLLEHHDYITEKHEANKKVHDRILAEHYAEYSHEHSHSMSNAPMFRSHAGTKKHQQDLHNAVDEIPTIKVSVTKKKNSGTRDFKGGETTNTRTMTRTSKRQSNSPAPRPATVPVAFNLSQHSKTRTSKLNAEKKAEVASQAASKRTSSYKPKVVVAHNGIHMHRGENNVVAYTPKHPHSREQKEAHAHTCEQILQEQLLRMMTLLLKSQLAKTSHDPVAVGTQMRERAKELIEKELSSLIHNLVKVQGPSGMHKNHALGR